MSVINTNVKALAAQESMRSSNLSMSQAMERLSTGKKINSAKDDAAGLAITNRMTSQIRGLAKAIGNVNDAISMTQTAEGALGNVGDILQRMRELSVQAASGTMTDTDRSSLQTEVSQLKSQIDLIAKTTNHNNIKLLDGSAQNITIQTGVNQNDTMKIGFASIQTKDIGVGSRAVVSSVGGTSAATSGALVEGNLFINGVAVGPSLTQDDSASTASASASAIAKAAAINRVSNLSGVYAKASSTVVSGASMAAGTAVSSGTVTINGVATDTFSTSLDTSLTRKTLVNAINAKTSITGVTATDTGDDTLGVTLEAADGRNINLVHTFNAGTIGIKPTGTTFVGSYSLYTLDGKDINVSSVTGSSTAVATSGLTLGTFKSNQAIFNSYARTAQSAAPGVGTTGLLDSSSLILNGVAIGSALNTDDTSSAVVGNSTRASSAIAIAASINRASGQSGVTAVANANILQGQSFTAVNVTKALIYVNGVAITANTMSLNGVIDSFNAKSGQTGVVASQWGSGMQLTAADGRNISIKSTAAASTFGLTGLTFGTNGSSYKTWTSTVSLKSDNAFTVKSGKTGITNLELLGLRQGTYGAADNGLKVNQIDVTTIAGASQAMTAIDAAINTVSQAQAVSGAYNNRFDSLVNNLSETNQNISASRSRILDTDYATETTSLAKQQIISQAATAMLAQANQSSQSILSLLK